MPYKPDLLWRFHWVSKLGPAVKVFDTEESFVGYINEVRGLCGASCVDWRLPRLAVGVIS
jgi:hypothetical protein